MHFPSALLALALALPGRLHARPYVYEPRENDPRIVLEEQPASETHCLGFDSRSRTCRFRDLFYDAASGRFRVYTHASVAAALQPLLDLADSSEPFLQVGMCVPSPDAYRPESGARPNITRQPLGRSGVDIIC